MGKTTVRPWRWIGPFLASALLALTMAMGRTAPADGPAQKSGALALSPDGTLLVTANPDSDTVTLVDLPNNTTEIQVGRTPRALALDMTLGRVYVANEGAHTLSVIDLTQRRIIETLPVGLRPVNLALSPDGTALFVAEMGSDSVRWLDTATLQTQHVIPVHDRPYGLAVTPDSPRLLVTHLLAGEVSVIELTDPPATTIITTWANVAPAPTVVINQTATRAYLPQTMAHGLGLNTQFDNSVFPKVSVLDLTENTHRTDEHISLPETDQPVGLPWDVALARGGRELWVVNAASNDISILNITDPTRPVRTAHIVVEDNPRGIVISTDGSQAYVNNTLAGTVSVIDTGTYRVIDTIRVTDVPLPPLLLIGKRLFYSSAPGELAQAAWMSCNSCHIEGEHDGRTWQLRYIDDVPPGATPIVRRNTTSLLGMIETYPLRWSAEWDKSADSEFSVRFEQYGAGLIDGDMHPTLGTPNQGRSAGLDALAAYIDSLLVPDVTFPLSPAAERGRATFESEQAQCAICHPPPLFTDLLTHDVGTANGPNEWFGPEIDTPTLRFVYDSAPYLHDGSADTLYDVLTTANTEDLHGVTSHLSEVELQDLVEYLLTLPSVQP